MKKFLSLALVTIMALICTACANAAADSEASVAQPELKYGRYYLNGDVNSKLYIDLDENYIVMGEEEELRKFFEDYFSEIGDYSNEEHFKANVDEAMNAYSKRSEYGYTTVNAGEIIHAIFFDYSKDGSFDKKTDMGVYYTYIEEGKIKVFDNEYILK